MQRQSISSSGPLPRHSSHVIDRCCPRAILCFSDIRSMPWCGMLWMEACTGAPKLALLFTGASVTCTLLQIGPPILFLLFFSALLSSFALLKFSKCCGVAVMPGSHKKSILLLYSLGARGYAHSNLVRGRHLEYPNTAASVASGTKRQAALAPRKARVCSE